MPKHAVERGGITIKDVAERAGVSAMTVSLAFRAGSADRRISPETKDRVLTVAKELNYRPNARARALRSGRTNVIGLYGGHGFINVRRPFFTEIVSGLQEGCEEIRKDLLLHGVFHGASPEEIVRELADGRIDGLIVSMPVTHPLAGRLAKSGFPVVAVADALPGIPSIVVDDVGGARMIADYLLDRGHRRVAYAVSSVKTQSGERRRGAFVQRARQIGLDVVDALIATEAETQEFARRMPADRVTAVACWNDDLAFYLKSVCDELGIHVPRLVEIVGFDGCPASAPGNAPITTVFAPWSLAAKTAVLQLDALMRGESLPGETVLPVRLVPARFSESS